MAQETMTVMVCDRCGRRLELRGDRASQEYSDALREASRWNTLRVYTVSGEDAWLLCPDDLAEYVVFINQGGPI